MPVPIFWICIGITSAAIGAIVYLEAAHRYNEYCEWQKYQEYTRNYQSSTSQDGPSHRKKEDRMESNEVLDNDDDKNKKAFVRHLNEDHELRRRPPRPVDSPLDTSEPGPNNRPVSDQGWVDRTDYELNELEKKITDRKRHLEMEQQLLDKAEMDLERRRQSLEQKGNDIHDRMNSFYSSSPSSSMLSSKISISKSLDDYQLTKDTMPRLSASKNDLSTANTTQEEQLNNKRDDTSLGTSQHSSTSFISVLPLSSSQPIPENQKTPDNPLTEQPSTDDTIDLKEGNPWVFHEDDEDDKSESLPASSSIDHHDNQSVSNKSSSDFDESWNDVLSLSSHAPSSTTGLDRLRSPSPPPSSSDGYDSIHHSDIENGH